MRSLFLVVVVAIAGGLALLLLRGKSATPESTSSAQQSEVSETRGNETQQLSAPTADPTVAQSNAASERTSAAQPKATPTPEVTPKQSNASQSTSPSSVAARAIDAVDPKSVGLDDEALDQFFATKYAGWSSERMTEAYFQVRDVCRAMEATPELLKTQQQQYQTLEREMIWLKEHRQE